MMRGWWVGVRAAWLALGAAWGVGGTVAAVDAAVPVAIPFIAEMSTLGGEPAAGVYDIEAALFGVAAGGAPAFGPIAFGSVDVEGGRLELLLEDDTGALQGALASGDAYLELVVDGVALAPRLQLLSVPYALRAADAERLAGTLASAYAQKSDLAGLSKLPIDTAAVPPANPPEGYLWYDAQSQQLWVRVGGQWVPSSLGSGGGTSGDLPEVSNGALTNAYADVVLTAAGLPKDLLDNQGTITSVQVGVNATEASGSYLTAVMAKATLQLLAFSNVRITLLPPVGSLVNPIVLFQGPTAQVCGSASCSMTWTSAAGQPLAPLVGRNPAGPWALRLEDLTQSSFDPTTVIVRVHAFSLTYSVVRSDLVTAAGDFEVQSDLRVGGTVGVGTQAPSVRLDVAGAIRVGDDTVACTAATQGAIRFDAASSRFVGCNGTQWLSLAGRRVQATFDALGANQTATISHDLGSPHLGVQVWRRSSDGTFIAVSTGATVDDFGCPASECGDGSEGVFAAAGNVTLTGGTHNFSSFSIPLGAKVTVTGAQPLDLRVAGAVLIAGELDLSGGSPPAPPAGVNATFPGGAGGGGGGGAGGDGNYSAIPGGNGAGPGGGQGGQYGSGSGGGGGGGGYASSGGAGASASVGVAGGAGGPAVPGPIGNNQLIAGSGGGAGGYGTGINTAGGPGGGGGGAVRIVAPTITISGTIRANGGNGASMTASGGDADGGAGGGGSGGAIMLRTTGLTLNGILQAKGGAGGTITATGTYWGGAGGAGAPGRISIEAANIAGGGTADPPYVYVPPTLDLSPANPVRVEQVNASTVLVRNLGAQPADLRVLLFE